MKAFFIPAGVLAVILGFSLWTGSYVEGRMGGWNALLAETDEAVRQEDWMAASERLERAYAEWDRGQTFLHIVMDHEELDKAEDLFAGAFAMCEERDRSGLRTALAQLASQMDALAETQSLGIKNIL